MGGVVDAIGDVVGGAADVVGDVVGGVADVVGDVVETVVETVDDNGDDKDPDKEAFNVIGNNEIGSTISEEIVEEKKKKLKVGIRWFVDLLVEAR